MTLSTEIVEAFEASANPDLAGPMKAYMKDRFEFFGIKSPQRKAISRPFMKEINNLNKKEVIRLVRKLWNRPERELHYFAQECLFKGKKHINEKSDIKLLEWMICQWSWWDTIDFIAPKLLKIYFDRFPEMRNKKVDQWVASDNIWLKRSAILLHLKQKDNVDLDYMFATVLRLCDTNEFFINKAIGWVLRENAKRKPAEVIDFVNSNKNQLSTLSVNQALKHVYS